MKPAIAVETVADRINHLHAEAVQHTVSSRHALEAALKAAWEAGRLLIEEKKRVRHSMGPGGWLLWLGSNFHGTPRTAQRYMRLARSLTDPSFVQGLSLRQAYDRLGIATEPKRRGQGLALGRLPAHVSLANKLVRALRVPDVAAPFPEEKRARYQGDLRALYDRLCALFEK